MSSTKLDRLNPNDTDYEKKNKPNHFFIFSCTLAILAATLTAGCLITAKIGASATVASTSFAVASAVAMSTPIIPALFISLLLVAMILPFCFAGRTDAYVHRSYGGNFFPHNHHHNSGSGGYVHDHSDGGNIHGYTSGGGGGNTHGHTSAGGGGGNTHGHTSAGGGGGNTHGHR
ncbi:MAG: hypothetical protein ACHP6H_03030 [Legionellales bacterium]